MKKNYKHAIIEVIKLDQQDILTMSQSVDFDENFIVDDYDEIFD